MKDPELQVLPAASFAKRLLAGLYDWLLVIAVMMVASVPFVAGSGEPVTAGNNLYRAFLAVIIAAYFCGFWRYGGQTVGMRAWRLRLVGATCVQVSRSQALTRFACACIGALPAGAGYWCMLFDPQSRSWHDRMSGTRLVQLPKPRH
ncbi:MAG: RDD family protein [Gammaproteobacteria bacterium]|nr:RDD family protein [Gammaproteobacteria bacterium]